MTSIERHNKRVEEDFINKKATRERKILELRTKISLLEKEIKELEKLNSEGPKLITKKIRTTTNA